jgi:hypothetical protein
MPGEKVIFVAVLGFFLGLFSCFCLLQSGTISQILYGYLRCFLKRRRFTYEVQFFEVALCQGKLL